MDVNGANQSNNLQDKDENKVLSKAVGSLYSSVERVNDSIVFTNTELQKKIDVNSEKFKVDSEQLNPFFLTARSSLADFDLDGDGQVSDLETLAHLLNMRQVSSNRNLAALMQHNSNARQINSDLNKIDLQLDGKISDEEIIRVLTRDDLNFKDLLLSINENSPQIQELINQIDPTGDRDFSDEEIIATLLENNKEGTDALKKTVAEVVLSKEENFQALKANIEKIDSNSDGTIDRDEVLLQVGKLANGYITQNNFENNYLPILQKHENFDSLMASVQEVMDLWENPDSKDGLLDNMEITKGILHKRRLENDPEASQETLDIANAMLDQKFNLFLLENLVNRVDVDQSGEITDEEVLSILRKKANGEIFEFQFQQLVPLLQVNENYDQILEDFNNNPLDKYGEAKLLDANIAINQRLEEQILRGDSLSSSGKLQGYFQELAEILGDTIDPDAGTTLKYGGLTGLIQDELLNNGYDLGDFENKDVSSEDLAAIQNQLKELSNAPQLTEQAEVLFDQKHETAFKLIHELGLNNEYDFSDEMVRYNFLTNIANVYRDQSDFDGFRGFTGAVEDRINSLVENDPSISSAALIENLKEAYAEIINPDDVDLGSSPEELALHETKLNQSKEFLLYMLVDNTIGDETNNRGLNSETTNADLLNQLSNVWQDSNTLSKIDRDLFADLEQVLNNDFGLNQEASKESLEALLNIIQTSASEEDLNLEFNREFKTTQKDFAEKLQEANFQLEQSEGLTVAEFLDNFAELTGEGFDSNRGGTFIQNGMGISGAIARGLMDEGIDIFSPNSLVNDDFKTSFSNKVDATLELMLELGAISRIPEPPAVITDNDITELNKSFSLAIDKMLESSLGQVNSVNLVTQEITNENIFAALESRARGSNRNEYQDNLNRIYIEFSDAVDMNATADLDSMKILSEIIQEEAGAETELSWRDNESKQDLVSNLLKIKSNTLSSKDDNLVDLLDKLGTIVGEDIKMSWGAGYMPNGKGLIGSIARGLKLNDGIDIFSSETVLTDDIKDKIANSIDSSLETLLEAGLIDESMIVDEPPIPDLTDLELIQTLAKLRRTELGTLLPGENALELTPELEQAIAREPNLNKFNGLLDQYASSGFMDEELLTNFAKDVVSGALNPNDAEFLKEVPGILFELTVNSDSTEGLHNNFIKNLRALDQDADLLISKDEYQAVIDARDANTSPLDIGVQDYLASTLAAPEPEPIELYKFDANGDGNVSREEMKLANDSMNQAFSTKDLAFDYDGDGEISQMDYVTFENELFDHYISSTEGSYDSNIKDPNYLAVHDIDDDGFVDTRDLLEILDGKLEKDPTGFDINGDGKVSQDELDQKFAEFRQAFGSELGDEDYKASFDYNKDGSINLLDFTEFRQEYAKYSKYDFDQDQNGEVTKAEIKEAFDEFKKSLGASQNDENYNIAFDHNNDGVIDQLDLESLKQEALAHYEKSLDGSFDTQITDDSYSLVEDINDDGFININDLDQIIEGVFENTFVFDIDGDGTITLDEAQETLAKFEEAFLSVLGDENYKASFDYDQDGDIDGKDRGKFGQEYNEVIKQFKTYAFDANNNGFVEKPELKLAHDKFEETFRSEKGDANYNPDFDYDKDGDVDASDLTKFGQELNDHYIANTARSYGSDITDSNYLEAQDINDDGFINNDDLQEILKGKYEKDPTGFDLNGDGEVTLDELEQKYTMYKESMQSSLGDSNYKASHDYDKDGDIDGQDYGKFGQEYQELLKQFKNYDFDHNGNGAIDKPELKIANDMFNRAFGRELGNKDYNIEFDYDKDGDTDDLDRAKFIQELTDNYIKTTEGSYGSSVGSEDYIAAHDINDDGFINLKDLDGILQGDFEGSTSSFDLNDDGRISRQELKDKYLQFRQSYRSSLGQNNYKASNDYDKDKRIGIQDFRMFINDYREAIRDYINDQRDREYRFDRDGNGQVSQKELGYAMKNFRTAYEATGNLSRVDRQFDYNNDRKVDDTDYLRFAKEYNTYAEKINSPKINYQKMMEAAKQTELAMYDHNKNGEVEADEKGKSYAQYINQQNSPA